MAVQMRRVQSSTISEIGYDEAKQLLYVRFNSGSLYEYKDVSEEEYKSIIEDVSIGSKLRKVVQFKEYVKL